MAPSGDRTEFVPGPSEGERTDYVPGPGGDFGVGLGGGERTEFVPGPADGERTEFVPGPNEGFGGSYAAPGEQTEYVSAPDGAERLHEPRWVEEPSALAIRTTDDYRRGSEPIAVGASIADVTVLGGPEAGTLYPLLAKSTLGRSPDCTVTLSDATVSAVHAVILKWGRRHLLLDWDSKGGTSVNGRRVSRAFLRNGDRISLATMQLQFRTRSKAIPVWLLAIWVVLGLGTVASLVYLSRGLWGG